MPAATLSRDARHLALPQIGAEGQRRIGLGTALLIGVGGIGCAAATYLASSGIGHLLISDFDTVDETNLGRQVLYQPGDIGALKAEVAAARLRTINPDVRITPIIERLSGTALSEAVAGADVVLDGCDNFSTRFEVNDACVAAFARALREGLPSPIPFSEIVEVSRATIDAAERMRRRDDS